MEVKLAIFEKKYVMILERTKDEILVRLPSNIDLSELQNMLDFLQYKELTSKSNPIQTDVDELSKTVNKSMWTKIKGHRIIK